MPEFFESIPDHLIPWLLDQHVFWVASAPLSKDGHVNLSPKGLKGSFRVNNANEVWYEDLMGSGTSFIWVVWDTNADCGIQESRLYRMSAKTVESLFSSVL